MLTHALNKTVHVLYTHSANIFGFVVAASTAVKVATQGNQILSRDQKERTGVFSTKRTTSTGV